MRDGEVYVVCPSSRCALLYGEYQFEDLIEGKKGEEEAKEGKGKGKGEKKGREARKGKKHTQYL